MFIKCQKCGKPLSDPDSMRRGYGPECWQTITGEPPQKERVILSRAGGNVGECDSPEVMVIPGQMTFADFPELIPEMEVRNGRQVRDVR